ncbi:acyltransferase family protein [Corynebacterium pseudotuberculosis]|uniref:acyltransferase family protein n=1 Tax=Corynebacterium pseudotuberculosis TaxID=1719 RepID=UPI0002660A0E|nr:acyltransferase family protein [Corynebacterium pseudotuberculosis]AFM08273.1 acyltransferase family protein [Corynebacterium pseudotuberculosis Cp162]APG82682.1 O-acetyltransferase [Corynebacterium pseudotuberculosis]WFP67092.1 acyltransferase family protein [Corynebacterium pseudotuberculosis]
MRIRNVPGIDGLRGIAVLTVVVYHFHGEALPGGFLGVDIFFVLSGFLITSLLIREYAAKGRIDLKSFWIRRARRILPASVSVLFVVTALTAALGGDLAVGLPSQFFSSLFFANNWTQIAGSKSYFSDSGIQVFAHYWSLAVEEQFYVVWPLLFVTITALCKKQWPFILGILSFTLATASAVWMCLSYDPAVDPSRIYYGTDTHSFGILIGATLAFSLTSRTSRNSWPSTPFVRHHVATAGAISGAILITLLIFVHDTHASTYQGLLVLSSITTALVLWTVVNEQGIVSQVVNNRVLQWCGQRSFSLYLWHWPVHVLITSAIGESSKIFVVLVSLSPSLALSDWSYRVIENPFRRQGYREYFSAWTNKKTHQKALSLPATLGIIALCIPFALWSSPSKTALETDLELLAQQQKAAQEESLRNAQQEEQKKIAQHRRLPQGNEILGIGDSVMLASVEVLLASYPGAYVDAAVSRQYSAALPLLDTLPLRPWVVLSFGTNGIALPGQIDQIMQKLGPDRTVVMVLPYGNRAWIPSARDEILDAAHRYPNIVIADWCGVAAQNPSLLRNDLIHPTKEGSQAYVDAITDAFKRWEKNDRNFRSSCI